MTETACHGGGDRHEAPLEPVVTWKVLEAFPGKSRAQPQCQPWREMVSKPLPWLLNSQESKWGYPLLLQPPTTPNKLPPPSSALAKQARSRRGTRVCLCADPGPVNKTGLGTDLQIASPFRVDEGRLPGSPGVSVRVYTLLL